MINLLTGRYTKNLGKRRFTMEKKKLIIIIIAAIFAVIALTAGIISIASGDEDNDSGTRAESELVANNMATGVTVIDKDTEYQTVNGFGASSACWAQKVGGWNNAEDIISLLYSEENGIGLNIYRYNLGAGSSDDECITDELFRTESFMISDGTLDFSRDKNAQSCLSIAKKLAGEELRVALFANSPPAYLTLNGKAYSSPASDDTAPSVSNLSKENYEAYADYLYACAGHFTDKGFRITEVSPINEPQYSWRASLNEDNSITTDREGCHFEPEEARELLKVTVKKFRNSDLHKKGVRVSMFESGEAEGTDSVTGSYFDVLLSSEKEFRKENKLLRDYFDTVSLHSYWSSTEKKQQTALMMAELFPGYSLACTEYSQRTNDGNSGVLEYIVNEGGETKGTSIEYGLAMADIIMTDLAVLNAVEWSWRFGCSFSNEPDGLIYLNGETPEEITVSKRLWCLGNFSKFIEEGAVRVASSSGVDELPMVSFVNTDGSTVAVYLNKTERYIKTDISAFCEENYAAYITNEEKNLEKADIIKDGILSIPAQSLVSVVFTDKEG